MNIRPLHDRVVVKRIEEKETVADVMAAVRQVDCVVIVTNHSTYDYPAILESGRLIVDTRNALGNVGRDHPKVVRL